MDRRMLRTLAKAEYKKMMKSRPKRERITFEQAFPLIRSMLENGITNEQMTSEVATAQELPAEDSELLAGMMEEPVEVVSEPIEVAI